MSEQQSEFQGWARVEVMGHQTHIGFVKTEAYGAAVLFRIDSPGSPEREYVLESPEYAYPIEGKPDLRTWCPAGTKVRRQPRPPVSVLVGAGSIYRIIPCTEAVALATIERETRAELIVVEPAGKTLPAAETPTAEDFGDDGGLCEDCGKPEDFCRCGWMIDLAPSWL
jgi:hypothetical protein